MIAVDRATVRVQCRAQLTAPPTNLYELRCTEHGSLECVSYEVGPDPDEEHRAHQQTMARLARRAHRHAEADHDGDVEREGWV